MTQVSRGNRPGVALPIRIHELLLSLAGRLDDDALADARQMLASAELDRSLEFVAGCLVAGGVVLSGPQHQELEELFANTFLDPSVIDRVSARDDLPAQRHRFAVGAVSGSEPDEGVAEAVRPVLDVLPDVRSVWCVWRLTPAGPVSGPVPHRVVLVGVGPAGFAPATAYRVEYALRRAGVRASVEVLVDGGQPTAYHQEAMRCARQVPFDDPGPGGGGGRPPVSPAEPVRTENFAAEPAKATPAPATATALADRTTESAPAASAAGAAGVAGAESGSATPGAAAEVATPAAGSGSVVPGVGAPVAGSGSAVPGADAPAAAGSAMPGVSVPVVEVGSATPDAAVGGAMPVAGSGSVMPGAGAPAAAGSAMPGAAAGGAMPVAGSGAVMPGVDAPAAEVGSATPDAAADVATSVAGSGSATPGAVAGGAMPVAGPGSVMPGAGAPAATGSAMPDVSAPVVGVGSAIPGSVGDPMPVAGSGSVMPGAGVPVVGVGSATPDAAVGGAMPVAGSGSVTPGVSAPAVGVGSAIPGSAGDPMPMAGSGSVMPGAGVPAEAGSATPGPAADVATSMAGSGYVMPGAEVAVPVVESGSVRSGAGPVVVAAMPVAEAGSVAPVVDAAASPVAGAGSVPPAAEAASVRSDVAGVADAGSVMSVAPVADVPMPDADSGSVRPGVDLPAAESPVEAPVAAATPVPEVAESRSVSSGAEPGQGPSAPEQATTVFRPVGAGAVTPVADSAPATSGAEAEAPGTADAPAAKVEPKLPSPFGVEPPTIDSVRAVPSGDEPPVRLSRPRPVESIKSVFEQEGAAEAERPSPRRRRRSQDEPPVPPARPRLVPAPVEDTPPKDRHAAALIDDMLNTQERHLLRELQDELARREKHDTQTGPWRSGRHGKTSTPFEPGQAAVNGTPPRHDRGRGSA